MDNEKKNSTQKHQQKFDKLEQKVDTMYYENSIHDIYEFFRKIMLYDVLNYELRNKQNTYDEGFLRYVFDKIDQCEPTEKLWNCTSDNNPVFRQNAMKIITWIGLSLQEIYPIKKIHKSRNRTTHIGTDCIIEEIEKALDETNTLPNTSPYFSIKTQICVFLNKIKTACIKLY